MKMNKTEITLLCIFVPTLIVSIWAGIKYLTIDKPQYPHTIYEKIDPRDFRDITINCLLDTTQDCKYMIVMGDTIKYCDWQINEKTATIFLASEQQNYYFIYHPNGDTSDVYYLREQLMASTVFSTGLNACVSLIRDENKFENYYWLVEHKLTRRFE